MSLADAYLLDGLTRLCPGSQFQMLMIERASVEMGCRTFEKCVFWQGPHLRQRICPDDLLDDHPIPYTKSSLTFIQSNDVSYPASYAPNAALYSAKMLVRLTASLYVVATLNSFAAAIPQFGYGPPTTTGCTAATVTATWTVTKPTTYTSTQTVTYTISQPSTTTSTVTVPVITTVTQPLTTTVTTSVVSTVTVPITSTVTRPVTATFTQPITLTTGSTISVTVPITTTVTTPVTITNTATFTDPVTTTVTITAAPSPVPTQQCNDGIICSCNALQVPGSILGTILGLLGVVLSDITGLVGVDCSRVVGGLGGNLGSKQIACCKGGSYGGYYLDCAPMTS